MNADPAPTPDDDARLDRARKRRMGERLDQLILAICYTALGLTAYIIVVGGLVCLATDSYTFEAYIQDLRQMSNWVLAAAIVIAAKLLMPMVRIRHEDDAR